MVTFNEHSFLHRKGMKNREELLNIIKLDPVRWDTWILECYKVLGSNDLSGGGGGDFYTDFTSV